MLTDLRAVLALAEQKKCAIPAFNVYNLETVLGVAAAAEEAKSPVILQVYSRLFEGPRAPHLAPSILHAAQTMSVPAAFHLDHGANDTVVQRALRAGATGIMRDASSLPFEENVEATKRVAALCAAVGVPVEGELGHVGTTKDDHAEVFTDPDEARRFAERTAVAALAIQVGTAHGRYRQAPRLDIERVAAIRKATGLPLVLHGGSGVPDDQLRAAIAAGIRKVNFGTDVCYAFLDSVFAVSRDIVAVDVFMRAPVESVKQYALSKIRQLGAEGCYA